MSTVASYPVGDVGRSWWLFLLYGVIAILFGLACVIWPGRSAVALVLAFGILSLADGIVTLFSIFGRDIALPRWLLFLYALVSIAFGVLAIMQPVGMADALLWVLAIWLVIAGIARIVMAVEVRKRVRGEWQLVLSGILAIILGILFFAMPGLGVLAVVLWIGVGAVIYGILQVGAAFRLRREYRPVPA